MGTRILEGVQGGDSHGRAVLYDSVTGIAFGPVFEDSDTAQAFLDFLSPTDARKLSPKGLEVRYAAFLVEKDAREEAELQAKQQDEREES